MNPVMKMRKKLKEKEREKRREAKKHHKREDENIIDDSYKQGTIDAIKKEEKEHYDSNPLSWNDLQRNMMTGSFNSNSNMFAASQGAFNNQNQYGRPNQQAQQNNRLYNYQRPTWEGDTLSSQPVLYNQTDTPASNNLPNTENNQAKPNVKPAKQHNFDEFDPLNPHKANKNFKDLLYKKDEPESKDAEEEKQETITEVQKELEKIKGSPILNTKFKPAALRKRKKPMTLSKPITEVSKPAQPSAEEIPDIEPNEKPDFNLSSLIPPSTYTNLNPLQNSQITSKADNSDSKINPARKVSSNSDHSSSSPSDSSDSGSSPKHRGTKISSALDSLMGRY